MNMTDRQTDHGTVTSIAIGKISSATSPKMQQFACTSHRHFAQDCRVLLVKY